jgi:DNA polymerase-3 subunit delta'
MTLALNLAQALNCEASEKPCGECVSCRKIAGVKHADVQIIGLDNSESRDTKAKEISIEQVREIQHDASLPPFEGKYKVFIIDGAEKLSTAAANCLLKTLEEPAERIIYLLLTTDEYQLPATVISRCQRLELPPLPSDTIEKFLTKRCEINPEKARLLSRLAHGCPGWAITTAEDDNILSERTAKIERIIEIIGAGIGERFDYAEQLATRFNQDRQAVQSEMELWLDWWHDLFLVKTASAEGVTDIDFSAGLQTMAEHYNLGQIRIFIDRIREATQQLKINASPRLVLEVLMLNIPGRNI